MKAKSRLVPLRFKQQLVDLQKTYVPTIWSSCVRLLHAIACELDFDLRHFDIDAIFVHLKLDADVLLHLP